MNLNAYIHLGVRPSGLSAHVVYISIVFVRIQQENKLLCGQEIEIVKLFYAAKKKNSNNREKI